MRLITVLCAALAASPALAEADKRFTLAAPSALEESGLLDYLLPRFALKTATRITRGADPASADAVFERDGRPVFEGPTGLWALRVGDDPDAQAFADWLGSEIGRDTVASFSRDGETPFSTEVKAPVAVAKLNYSGDVNSGASLSLSLCGRCHVVGEVNRMNSIGSTPSFGMLRTLPDWSRRFEGFYALAPHPAFTQIEEVTLPFDPMRPSPIAPIEMTLDELDDILAFVADIPPADLGEPVQSR
ncbi:hypothetical protein FIU97_14470 [Roseivivax sp. THAF40]|uniref:hypothetical protein n=1 Tax=unclassified Roseivivax TaxID=2639302 RepID=UPI001268A254|nr:MULTISPECIES: hypothetical protein [unclassified Roseivivax]QFS83951.1 hypothetical protein FIV09_14030 [Roseivivax sp. THAF197b]QFT47783.1 hypothetical protein FIU97_14470 [Roseivivax sp. THAF40]